MNGKEICPVETVTVIVRAVLPWDSADGKDRIEICTHDRQSQIDYCLNHCPYAECVNCAGGGRTTSRGGRPPFCGKRKCRSCGNCWKPGQTRRTFAGRCTWTRIF